MIAPDTATRTELNRVTWQCRRGMRELDELLNRFVDTHYHQLDAAQRQSLDNLLEYPDDTLLELLMGRMTSSDANIARLVQAIRHTTAS